jgi:hypothetical protein
MASNPMTWPMVPWFNWIGRPADLPAGGNPVDAMKLLSAVPRVNGDGDPALEREIVEDVATYGAQLGLLSEVVLAMAAGQDLASVAAFTRLKAQAEAIEKKKAEYGRTALERARKAVDELRVHDRAGYDLLVASLEARTRT